MASLSEFRYGLLPKSAMPRPFPGQYPTRIFLAYYDERSKDHSFRYLGKPCAAAFSAFKNAVIKPTARLENISLEEFDLNGFVMRFHIHGSNWAPFSNYYYPCGYDVLSASLSTISSLMLWLDREESFDARGKLIWESPYLKNYKSFPDYKRKVKAWTSGVFHGDAQWDLPVDLIDVIEKQCRLSWDSCVGLPQKSVPKPPAPREPLQFFARGGRARDVVRPLTAAEIRRQAERLAEMQALNREVDAMLLGEAEQQPERPQQPQPVAAQQQVIFHTNPGLGGIDWIR